MLNEEKESNINKKRQRERAHQVYQDEETFVAFPGYGLLSRARSRSTLTVLVSTGSATASLPILEGDRSHATTEGEEEEKNLLQPSRPHIKSIARHASSRHASYALHRTDT